MASNAPHTISVKRKRGDAPVDSLVAERNDKRIKSTPFPPADTPVLPGNPALKRKLEDDALSPTHPRKILWRRIKAPHTPESKTLLNSPLGYGSAREFRISHSDGLGVLVEHHQGQSDEIGEDKNEGDGDKEKEEEGDKIAPVATYRLKSSPQATSSPSKPRKRPGAGTAVQAREKLPLAPPVPQLSPSEETIRAFEKFSAQVEDEDSAASSSSRSPTRSPARLPTHPAFVSFVKAPKSPKKLKPNVPKLRYKDRHPDSKYVIGDKPTPMDVDEYVYDTYEIVKPDANGHIPDPVGTVGVIVLEEEDEEFWFGDEESEDFATDSDDENAEDYYANDYPEDEMSSDDEFGRNDYAYYHGDDSEEFDLAEGEPDDSIPEIGEPVPKTRMGWIMDSYRGDKN